MTIIWCTVPELSSMTGRIFCYFELFFVLIPGVTTWKIKILKNWKKKIQEISSFYNTITKIMILCYTVPEIWHIADVIVIFHFGLFFALLHRLPGLPLLSKTKVQDQFKVLANISPRIQSFCTFFKVLQVIKYNNNHNFFLLSQTFTKIYFHVYTKQDKFHTLIS